MIVHRGYGAVKRGRMSDAIALLNVLSADMSETVRIYEPLVGDNDLVGYEIEFEDLAHCGRWSNESSGKPEIQEGLKKWYELTTGFRNELLKLA